MPMPTNHLKVQYEFYFRLVQTHPKQLPVGYGIEKLQTKGKIMQKGIKVVIFIHSVFKPFGVWPTVPITLICDFRLTTTHLTNINSERKEQSV